MKTKKIHQEMMEYGNSGIPRCCRKDCLKDLTIEELLQTRELVQNLKGVDRKVFIQRNIVKPKEDKEGTWKFYFNQNKICLRGFTFVYGVSNHMVYSTDSSCSQIRIKPKEDIIMSFLNEMAEKSNYMPNASEIHLPYTTKIIVYDLFTKYLEDNNFQKISKKHFVQVWKSKLKHIKVRKVTKFSKCDICVNLDEKIITTRDETMNAMLKKRKHKHVMEMLEDRDIYETHKKLGVSMKHKYLSIAVDGADFGKYGLPYFWQKDKQSEKGYKNPISTIIVIIHGHGTCVYTIPIYLPNDSNSIIHIIHKTFTFVKELYLRNNWIWPNVLLAQV